MDPTQRGYRNQNHARPLIGITTYLEQARWGVWDRPAALLPRNYLDGIVRAGGVPVLLPPVGAGHRDIAGRIDALVLAGGADLEPASYGQEPHPRTAKTRPDRDAHEFAVLRAAVDAELPVLGVCRGMELLNVALGGSLRQHLPDVVDHCGHQPETGVFGRSKVTVRDGSLVAGILGAETEVRCYHHQAIDRLGDGLRPTAWTDDGTVEAIELSTADFVLGVQWHPEENDTDIRLFQAIVERAHSNRPHRTDSETTTGRAAQ